MATCTLCKKHLSCGCQLTPKYDKKNGICKECLQAKQQSNAGNTTIKKDR